jgi:hypothetical protein
VAIYALSDQKARVECDRGLLDRQRLPQAPPVHDRRLESMLEGC